MDPFELDKEFQMYAILYEEIQLNKMDTTISIADSYSPTSPLPLRWRNLFRKKINLPLDWENMRYCLCYKGWRVCKSQREAKLKGKKDEKKCRWDLKIL